MKKVCFKCGVEKDLDSFYKHPMMKDGRLNKCKECTKSDVTRHREANLDRIREYDSSRGNRQTKEDQKAYRAKFPNKARAVRMVNYYVSKGELSAKDCEVCGSGSRTHAHHDDYSKPLDIRWLCPACHKAWHKEHGEGKNG